MRVQVLAETKMSEFVCLYYSSIIVLYHIIQSSHTNLVQCIALTWEGFYMGRAICYMDRGPCQL